MGSLLAIWIKRGRRGPMDSVDRAQATAGQGLEGNANQGGRRQVTILSEPAWRQVEAELGAELDPRLRRANLFVDGLELAGSRGRTLRIGDCRIRIGGETRPCKLMDDGHPGLQTALDPDWRGGIFGQVLNDAELNVGDAVDWEKDGDL